MTGRFAVIGVAAGFCSGLFGIGGGIVMVPLLVIFGRLDQRRAAATSLLAIIPTALVGAATYGSQGRLSPATAAIVGIGAMTGSWLGARWLRVIRIRVLTWCFIALLVGVGVWMAVFAPVRGEAIGLSPWSAVAMVALGLAIGMVSALFGIGGGVLAVPALMGLFGFGDLVARGTSLLVIVPSAMVGSLTNRRGGLVEIRPAITAGLAACVGTVGGSAVAFAVPTRLGGIAFAVLLLGSAVQLGVRATRGRP